MSYLIMHDITLALLTGIDIPIPECQITLHQPTIKEISYIGEKQFFLGISLLCINKNAYTGPVNLDNVSNFYIFNMMIENAESKDKKQAVLDTFTILFPKYKIFITPRSLLFNSNEETFIIDESNFEFLQKVLSQVLCLQKNGQEEYKPANQKAKEIADKLMRGRQKVAQQQQDGKGDVSSQLVQYLSVLTVGLNSMSLKDTMELTIYQLYDLIERYMLFINWDLDIRTRLAGGSPDKSIDNWMKAIH